MDDATAVVDPGGTGPCPPIIIGRFFTVRFLPERDYVTFGSLLSQFRLSSVTFVHPTQGVEAFGNYKLGD